MSRIKHYLWLLVFVVFFTGCISDLQAPSDEEIWQAYIQITQPSVSSTNEQARLIEAAKRDHSIERLGAGDAIVGQPSQSGFCMPDHLRQSKTEVRGRSYLAHVFSKADRRQYVSIDLTRWEGVDGWWVSSVTFKDKCLQM